jgi:hypothetical protein
MYFGVPGIGFTKLMEGTMNRFKLIGSVYEIWTLREVIVGSLKISLNV